MAEVVSSPEVIAEAEVVPSPEVIAELADQFRRNGYVRWPDAERRAATRLYKKGYEVRLVAGSVAELKTIRRLFRAAGFTVGRPFLRAGLWRQPMYGRLAVARFLHLIGWSPDAEPDAAPDPARTSAVGSS